MDASHHPDSSMQHLEALKETIASTMNSVSYLEAQLRQMNSNRISEEVRKTILDDVYSKVSNAKSEISQSLKQHKNIVNRTLDTVVQRIEDLKSVQINDDGSILEIDQAQKLKQQNVKLSKKIFSQKIFVERDSILTFEEGKDSGFRTLENIFLAFLFLLGVQICVDEYFEKGNFFPGLDLFYWVFGQFGTVIQILLSMYLISYSVVFLVQMIQKYNIRFYMYLPLYSSIQMAIYFIGVYSCFYYQFPPASAIVTASEMARTSMKIHAYFREKLINCINKDSDLALFIPDWAQKLGVTKEDLDQPKIDIKDSLSETKRYLYFFFCPTLIYRDEYIRTRKIRWNIFLKNLGTFLFLIFYVWSIFKAMCIPVFRDTALNPGGVRQFFNSVIFSTVSGIVCLLSMFYGMLHCWMNIFGELLRFGDRLFYEDWWNVRDFAGYYRKWNIIVHEFLYYYIYQDSIRFTRGTFSRSNSKYLVFFISALIHEVIITCGLGFFFPVLFLMFGGPGVIFTQFKFGNSPYSGTLFWVLMLIGSGLLMVAFCREFYARQLPHAASLMNDGLWATIYPQALRFWLEKNQS